MGHRHQAALAFLLAALTCFLCGCTALYPAANPRQEAFSPETEGLVLVKTEDESDHSIRYRALAPGERSMETDPFTPDEAQVFTFADYEVGRNNLMGPYVTVHHRAKEPQAGILFPQAPESADSFGGWRSHPKGDGVAGIECRDEGSTEGAHPLL